MTDLTGHPIGTESESWTRVFELVRHEDVTGFSGVGVVADGVEFPDGSVVFRWRSSNPSTVVFDSIDGVVAVHGHDGATEIRWIEPDSTGEPDAPVGTDEAGRLGTAWERHDDLLWPPLDPNPPRFLPP